MARPVRFELTTLGSVDRCSIQLSYGRVFGGGLIPRQLRRPCCPSSATPHRLKRPPIWRNPGCPLQSGCRTLLEKFSDPGGSHDTRARGETKRGPVPDCAKALQPSRSTRLSCKARKVARTLLMVRSLTDALKRVALFSRIAAGCRMRPGRKRSSLGLP